MHKPLKRALRPLFALAAALVFATACGANGDANAPSPEAIASNDAAAPAVTAGVPVTPEAQTGISLIATADGSSLDIWDRPGGTVVNTVAAADVLTVPDQTPLTFLVAQQQADWYQVYLPVRPNGATGWVPASDVTITGTDFAIDVYLGDHTLVLSQGGAEVARFSVGVGASDKPTPGGVYYLRELLQPPDPTGLYGPYAYGLSGYSPVLDSFNGGDAVIGLHGTNDPSSIGGDVSHGCLRMRNEDITSLVEQWSLPLGTPVIIHE